MTNYYNKKFHTNTFYELDNDGYGKSLQIDGFWRRIKTKMINLKYQTTMDAQARTVYLIIDKYYIVILNQFW